MLLGSAVVIAISVGALYLVMRGVMYDQMDKLLSAKVTSLTGLMGYTPPYLEFDSAEDTMREFVTSPSADFFQIWIEDQVLDRSESLEHYGADLPRRSGAAHEPVLWSAQLPDGRAGRYIGMQYPVDVDDDPADEDEEDEQDPGEIRFQVAEHDGPPDTIIVVATSREQIDQSLAAVAVGGGAAVLVLCAGLALLVYWTTGRGLAPLIGIGTEAEAIGSNELDHRFDDAKLPAELKPLATGLNRLLSGLEEAFHRERRTTSNIAHELRTPIAELRNATDVSLKWPDDDQLAHQTISEAQAIAIQMDRIVSTLLRMARAETNGGDSRRQAVPIAALIDKCCSPFARKAASKNLRIEPRAPDDIVGRTDPEGIELIVTNLIANAIDHSPENSVLSCVAQANCDVAHLTVSNPNTQLTQSDLRHLTEPFWTRDQARSDRRHCGLGLAVVAALAQALTLDLQFKLENGQFRATISIPLD